MRTMTWEEIDKDWAGLQKRHRMEIGEAVARYCIGHSMQEVAKHLGYSNSWVQRQLDYAGMNSALGGSGALAPLTGGSKDVSKNEVPRLLSEFAPDVKVPIVDDGQGNQQIDTNKISGEDADEFKPYVEHYINEGHEPAAATRLAKAEWAAESAADAGVIKETKKGKERVNQILFPDAPKQQFELDLKMHMNRVKLAAKFLDDANMASLRKKSTGEMVASANDAWFEQVERVLNLHPTINQ